jgi:hypothetical protein
VVSHRRRRYCCGMQRLYSAASAVTIGNHCVSGWTTKPTTMLTASLVAIPAFGVDVAHYRGRFRACSNFSARAVSQAARAMSGFPSFSPARHRPSPRQAVAAVASSASVRSRGMQHMVTPLRRRVHAVRGSVYRCMAPKRPANPGLHLFGSLCDSKRRLILVRHRHVAITSFRSLSVLPGCRP